MIGNYFYNESTRNVVVGFGSVFNNIQLAKKDAAGNVAQTMKVPLAYGPKAKWLARLREDPALNKKVAVTLPRIGFEISGLSYDPNRKLNKSIKVKKAPNGTNAEQIKSGFMPVPYNVDFELFIMSKNSDDALQIIEQILPYFQPDYTVTMIESRTMDTKRDIPFILESVNYEDSYAGSLTDTRRITYSLSFTAKIYLYGPISTSAVIKKVSADLYDNTAGESPFRKERVTVTPNPTSADKDDTYTYTTTLDFFDDGKNYDEETGNDV